MMSGNDGMQKFTETIYKIQDVCTEMQTTLEYQLPQIVVVGSQGVGKSSILESFVGRDFLPRGSGIVTRRPLILQLMTDTEEYGEFTHFKEDNVCKKIYDFDEIRAEIQAETDRVVGTNEGVSHIPINLRIHSPNVLNLTLVDLPGMLKIPIGDQANIGDQIKAIIRSFINNEKSIILAVSAANTDLANSDALEIAKQVDKNYSRTIGVLTKVDLMDRGTDARYIFDNRVKPLSGGYIGVVNRSQEDIVKGKDIKATLEFERDFFNKHDKYKDIANRLGTPYLQKFLSAQLINRLKEEVRMHLTNLEKELNNFENVYPREKKDTIRLIFNIIYDLQQNFEIEMGSLSSNYIHNARLSHGAKIRHIFQEVLPSKIFKIKIEEGQLRHDIEVAVSNAYGVDGVLNTPFKAFESLAQVQISRLQGPIESCLLLVMMELNKSVQACVGKINNYPIFQEYISRDISSFLQNTIRSNLSNVLNLVEMELAYINSTNYGFGKGLGDKLLEQITSVYGSFSDDQKRHFFGDLVNQLDCHVKKPGGIVYREGILYFNDSDNPYRFVLRYDPRYEKHTLSYYDLLDNSSKYAFLTIQMDNLKFRLETDYYHRNLLSQKIVIFKPSGGEVARNILEIVLSSACESEICLWTKYLSQVIEMDGKTATGLYLKDIDEAYDKIVSYVSTVKKTMCNMVPKAIMSSIVRNVEKYIQKDLLVKMAEKLNDGLLEMFAPEKGDSIRYSNNLKMQENYRKALEIMEEYDIQK